MKINYFPSKFILSVPSIFFATLAMMFRSTTKNTKQLSQQFDQFQTLVWFYQQVGGKVGLETDQRLEDVYVMVYQNVSISKGSSEIAILVEKVAGHPVSLNLGQPHRASTPPCWVNLVVVVLKLNTF